MRARILSAEPYPGGMDAAVGHGVRWVMGALSVFSLSACGQDANVSFRTGELVVSVRAGELGVPDTLREDEPAGPIVRSVPCTACPALPTTCVAGLCDPNAIDVSFPLGTTLDFDALRGDFELPIGRIDEIRLRGGSWRVQSNTLTVGLEAVEVWWAPEGTAAGVTPLGGLGDIPAGQTPNGGISIDSAGEAELSAYLGSTSSRAQLFVSLTVDIDPGQPFPEGDLTLSVALDLTALGPLL